MPNFNGTQNGDDGTGIDVINLNDFKDSVSVLKLDPETRNITGRIEYSQIEQVVICFTPETRLATVRGEVAAKNLRQGDRVITRDNGIQSLAWTGKRDLTPAEMARHPEFNPVHIRKGALGDNVPERDMVVSPNHRMLITTNMAGVLFGEREVLVAAKDLTSLDGIDQITTPAVQYIHLMFEQHEIVLADGAWTESFQPEKQSLNGVACAQRGEIISLFPELDTSSGVANYGAARLSLKKHEAVYLSRKLAS